MSFQNVYYNRATATPRACYVCSKPTIACLATANAVDFLYTCETHLSDRGFATELVVDPGAAATANPKEAVSKEEIARVKAEWEAREERKKEKGKAKAKETGGGGGKDVSMGAEGEKEEGRKDRAKSQSPPVAVSGATTPTPTHKRYSLHRDLYAMRQAEHRRRRQKQQMQELAPRLPGAPHGSLVG